MRILFHLPTRSRPQKARESIQNIIDYVESDDYKIIVTLDTDDDSMIPFTFVHPKVILIWGKSFNKIHACNRSISFVKEWDILVNTSDDMRFQVKGFDNKIREAFTEKHLIENIGGAGHYLQDVIELDRLVHFNDGNQRDNVCTLPIMGRKYYERFNYVYHPDYKSLWCDNEQTDVAKMLGRYKYMGHENIIFRHLHPAWGLSSFDEQYRKTESLFSEDKSTYERRRANGFN